MMEDGNMEEEKEHAYHLVDRPGRMTAMIELEELSTDGTKEL